MLSRTQQAFLQKKIMELEQALFFNYSRSVLKLPTSLINALHVDDIGQVWFMLKRPTQKLYEFERQFQSRLECYKKGKNFHLQVAGRSCIVIEPEEINFAVQLCPAIRQKLTTDMILIRMEVAEIYYYPHNEKMPQVRILPRTDFHPSAFIKTLQYIVKDIIPVLQTNRNPYESRRNVHS